MRIFLVYIIVTFFSCVEPPKNKPEVKETFDWLIGNWIKSNDVKGKKTYEHWIKINDSLYQGLGFTLDQTDTVFMEKIKFIKSDGIWSYNVSTDDQHADIPFKVIDFNANSFVCENVQHDFPKQIHYSIENDSLKAIISGDGQSVAFYFGKYKE